MKVFNRNSASVRHSYFLRKSSVKNYIEIVTLDPDPVKDSTILWTKIQLNQLNQIKDADLKIGILTCSEDAQLVRDILPIMTADRSKLPYVTSCEIIPIDISDPDFISSRVDYADIIVIALSNYFCSRNLAFQSLIYTIRTMKKKHRYWNIKNDYGYSHQCDAMQQSHIALLFGNSYSDTSWKIIWEGWILKYKTSPYHKRKRSDNSNNSMQALLHNEILEICSTLLDASSKKNGLKELNWISLNSRQDIDALENNKKNNISCALVFVSSAFAQDDLSLEALDVIKDKRIPIIVVGFESNVAKSNWSKTGLGLLLANELWIDFTRKPFYLPDEIIPSFERKIDELSSRILAAHKATIRHWKRIGLFTAQTVQLEKNISLMSNRAIKHDVSVYVSYCHKNSAATTFHDICWPLPPSSNIIGFKNQEHGVLRYCSYLNENSIDVNVDVKFSLLPKPWFETATLAANAAPIHIQFWSEDYVNSFYCQCEMAFAMLHHNKMTIIVFLEDEKKVKNALKSMPVYERILAKLAHMQLSLDGRYSESFNLYSVSAVNQSFENISKLLIELISFGRNRDHKTYDDGNKATNENDNIFPATSNCDILISYCWNNSKAAYDNGQVSNYNGHTDPRFLKKSIESSTGLKCWLDIEQLGIEGLYAGIHAAYDSVKCVLLCVSDEYCNSPNCMMELEYSIRSFNIARNNGSKPIDIFVINVGSGYRWKSTTAGYFLANREVLDFVTNSYPHSLEGKEQFAYLIEHLKKCCAKNI
eukprot:gene7131-9732_t